MTKHSTSGWTNWSGLQQAKDATVFKPTSNNDLSAALPGLKAPIRPVGSGHSFTPLVPTDGTIVDIKNLSGIISADSELGLATVAAGTQLRDLGPQLRERGLNLPNQGDIDHQTLAGAVGTGTHGTGRGHGSLSTFVQDITFATPSGEFITFDYDTPDDQLNAARLNLGLLGVAVNMTLCCDHAYDLAEESTVLHIDEAVERWDEIANQHRHAELFWFPYDDRVILKTLDLADDTHKGWPEAKPLPPIDTQTGEDVMFEAAATTVRFFPTVKQSIQNALLDNLEGHADRRCGPAHLIYPSPRNARFNEMEYSVPATDGLATLKETVAAIRKADVPVMWPLEFRTLCGDGIWLSPAYGRDSTTISVHQYGPVDHRPLFEVAEPMLQAADGRPHWGKLHTLKQADLSARLPKFDDFCALREKLDPEGRFLTPYLRSLFVG